MATLGKITTGSTSLTVGVNGAAIQKITVGGSDIDIEAIVCYAGGNPGYAYAKACIWLASDGSLVASGNVSKWGTFERWRTISFTTRPTLSASTSYYIGFVVGGGTNPISISTDTSGGSAGNARDTGNSYASPTTFTGDDANNYNISMYAVYGHTLSDNTLGETVVLDESVGYNGGTTNNQWAQVNKVTVPAGGDILVDNGYTWVRKWNADSSLKFCIWDSSNAIVANSESSLITLNSTYSEYSWVKFTYSTRPVLEAGQDYYIGCINGANLVQTEASTAGSTLSNASDRYNDVTNPHPLTLNFYPNYLWSIYIDYTASPTGYGNDVFSVGTANIGKVFSAETANIDKVFGS